MPRVPDGLAKVSELDVLPRGTRDLTGLRVLKLEVLKFIGSHDNHALWRCRCDCGALTTVRSDHLISGHAKSCGCYRVIASRRRLRARVKKSSSIKFRMTE